MKKNMSSADSIIRVIIAAIMVTLYFTGIIEGTWGIVLIALSAIFVLTSMVNFCPIYTLFGISTRKKTSEK